MHRSLSLGLASLTLALTAPAVVAQNYPTKPVRLVVPTPVSTPVDTVSRVVAAQLSNELGQPVVVENRGGAQGIVGAQSLLQNSADGYNLLALYMPMTVGQSIYSNVPYDLRTDFVPIAQTAWSYNTLVVHPSVPANSVAELVELLKANPGQYSFGSGGPGTPAHIAGELLKQQTGTDALHVPYNQFPQAITDLLAGRLQFMFVATTPVVDHIKSGNLRALAITGPKRIPVLPEIPTMGEAGYADFVVRDWQGIVAKRGTPENVIQAVNQAVQESGSFGPEFVTADELPPGASGLQIQCRLNGEVMQNANTRDMIFDVATLVAACSEGMTLQAGDIIIAGTPAGVGLARKPQVWMQAGDTCEVEIEGIGVLRNPVVDEQ